MPNSLNFLAAAITTTFVVTSTLALPSNNINQESPPLSSYSADLPPDIAPLFPSTGAAGLTIPSTRSPGITGLDSTAFEPSGSLQDSSVAQLGFDVVVGFLFFWLLLVFIM